MKRLKKFAKFLMSPFMVGIVVTFATIYTSILYYEARERGIGRDDGLIGLIGLVHEKSIDWRLIDRGAQKGHPQVAVLAVDDHSLTLEGRWPWPRDKQGRLIDRAMYYGAKSVSFDMVFSEEDNNSSLPTLNRLMMSTGVNDKVPESLRTKMDEEFSKADLDKIYANSIQAYQDQLVLGSFFGAGLNIFTYSPQGDACMDVSFQRSYAGRYWKKETGSLTILDEYNQKNSLPEEIKTGIGDYLNEYEYKIANEYFEDNPTKSKNVEFALDSMAKDLDPALFPLLSVMVINDDVARATTTLGEALPMYNDPEIVRKMFDRFSFGLGPVEKARLASKFREAGFKYCLRFLTENDELLNISEYKKRWGDSPEANEQFKTMGWASVLKLGDQDGRNPSSIAPEISKIASQFIRNRVPAVVDWATNIPMLANATKHSGYFNATLDSDGAVRRSRLITRTGSQYIPSLALRTFLVNHNATAIGKIGIENLGQTESSSKVLTSLEVMDAKAETFLKIPTDFEGQMMINYSGKQHMFPHVSAAELLNDAPDMTIALRQFDPSTGEWHDGEDKVNKKEFMKDKMLILGATAIGVYDLRVTPFDENFPGVETHANALSNMLVEKARAHGEEVAATAPGFLRFHPDEGKVMWMILLGLGLVLSGLLSYFGAVSGLGITAACLGAIYAIDKYYFFQSGIITTALFPVSLVSGNYVSLTFYKYFTEERKKQALKGTFAKYVSPAIVDEILADPENIELGGKKMDLTVMFSDVRGFTAFSEKLDPRALSDFLNSYLTPMTNIVFENKGTLDKYMGDAIMSFWGAPIHFNDHAHHACRCALKML
ncbi:MAG: CHASE2 domain-containing protein, partial [Bdellovibrionota bacterium]